MTAESGTRQTYVPCECSIKAVFKWQVTHPLQQPSKTRVAIESFLRAHVASELMFNDITIAAQEVVDNLMCHCRGIEGKELEVVIHACDEGCCLEFGIVDHALDVDAINQGSQAYKERLAVTDFEFYEDPFVKGSAGLGFMAIEAVATDWWCTAEHIGFVVLAEKRKKGCQDGS